MQNHCSKCQHLSVPRYLFSTFLAPKYLMGTSILSWHLGTRWVSPYFSVPVRQIRYPGAVLTPLPQSLPQNRSLTDQSQPVRIQINKQNCYPWRTDPYAYLCLSIDHFYCPLTLLQRGGTPICDKDYSSAGECQ